MTLIRLCQVLAMILYLERPRGLGAQALAVIEVLNRCSSDHQKVVDRLAADGVIPRAVTAISTHARHVQ